MKEDDKLNLDSIISLLLIKAEELYGNKYDYCTIEMHNGEPYIMGYELVDYEPAIEEPLCKVIDLLNDL